MSFQRLLKPLCGSTFPCNESSRPFAGHRMMRECEIDLTAFSKMETPHGAMTTATELPAANGDAVALHCNNPFAFLWPAPSRNNEFGDFIHGCLTSNGARGRVVVCIGETTLGDALRPGHERSFELVPFSFAELPHWYLKRRHGFFKFAFIEVVDVLKVVGGMPAIVNAMMYIVFLMNHCGVQFRCYRSRAADACGV